MTKGRTVPGDKFRPGRAYDLYIMPLVTQVQISSLLIIKFTTASPMYKGGAVEITLPTYLTVPAIGTSISVTPMQGTTQATSATIVEGKNLDGKTVTRVRIENLVLDDEIPSRYTFEFGLSGIENQISEIQAGKWDLTTYYYRESDKKYYIIDQQEQLERETYEATRGLLTATKDMSISPSVNYADNAVYIFEFQENSMVPAGGWILIEFPNDINFNAETIVKLESCSSRFCELDATDPKAQKLWIKTNERFEKEQPRKIQLGGMKNSRSFQPSGSFVITTHDQSKNVIDQGFNKNVATTVAGDITLKVLSRGSVVNGEVNTYKLSLTTTVPLKPNDVIKFTFPAEITVNAKGLATVCTPEVAEDIMNCGISGNDIQIIMLSLADRGEPK